MIGSIDLDMIENSDKSSFNHSFRASCVQSNELRLHGVLSNHCLFAGFSGHSSTTEHEYISGSRLNTVGISDLVGITITFHNIRISSVSQTIANCVSKISKDSL